MLNKLILILFLHLTLLPDCKGTEGISIGELKNVLHTAVSKSDSLEILERICDHYDISDFSNKDSLGYFSEIYLNLSSEMGRKVHQLQAKCYLANTYSLTDSLSFYRILSEARDGFLEEGMYLNAAKAETQMGLQFAYTLEMDNLRSYMNNALSILDKIEQTSVPDYEQRSLILYYISNSYNYGESYDNALYYALEMQDLAKENGLEKRLLMSYQILGKIYGNLAKQSITEDDYKEDAEHFLRLAMELTEQRDIDEMKYGSAFTLGEFLFEQGRYQEAKELFESSLSLVRKVGNTAYEFNNLLYLSKTSLEMGDSEKALVYCRKAQTNANQNNAKVNQLSIDLQFGNIHTQMGNWDKARGFIRPVLDNTIAQQNLDIKLKTLRLLEQIETQTGNYELAISLDKEADETKDSIVNLKTLNNVLNLRNKFELNLKQEEIANLNIAANLRKLKNQNTIKIVGMLALVILSMLMAFIFRQKSRKEKQAKNIIKLEQKLLRSQINPHFIFNAISSIQNYLYNKSDLNIALNYMSKLGHLMRQVLEYSREEYIPLKDEVSAIENYLEMQKFRYNNQFNYAINIDPELDNMEILVPPLISQPFVENAIEHGMIYKVEHGLITVNFALEQGFVNLKISDNGIGKRKLLFKPKENSIKKKSLATIITQERLNHISKIHKKKFQLISEALQSGGMMININLPIIKA